ncbi:MAG: flagellar biosynthesis regulator FlaF [Hyphomicrobiales bacterium]
MNQGLSAYAKTARTGISQRQLEAQLLIKAANRLKAVQDNWDKDRSDLDEAVIYNRKLWTVLVTSATETDNPLDRELKVNIANIAIFIFNRSLDIITDTRPEQLDVLININRTIAQGLMTEPAPSQSDKAS